MIDTKEFTNELKRYGVAWNEDRHLHYCGKITITNKDMKIMCSTHYGSEYDLLTKREQRLVRESIFKAIRYGVDE